MLTHHPGAAMELPGAWCGDLHSAPRAGAAPAGLSKAGSGDETSKQPEEKTPHARVRVSPAPPQQAAGQRGPRGLALQLRGCLFHLVATTPVLSCSARPWRKPSSVTGQKRRLKEGNESTMPWN